MTDASTTAQPLPDEIPLFPLNMVLFPGGVLQLKLFEARYLDMAARCMREQLPFGVCLIREGSEVGDAALPHDFGSMARIANWDMTQPGLLMITARGGPRFRIVERKVLPDRLQTARVAWQPEPPAQPVPARLEAIVPLLRAIVEDAGLEDFPPLHRFDDATWVGYRMAEVLPIPHQARLRLLELDDPISRLEIIHAFLTQHKLID